MITIEDDDTDAANDKPDEQPRKKQRLDRALRTVLPERTLERASLAHRKLVATDQDDVHEQTDAPKPVARAVKYTPLEQQVVEVRQHRVSWHGTAWPAHVRTHIDA